MRGSVFLFAFFCCAEVFCQNLKFNELYPGDEGFVSNVTQSPYYSIELYNDSDQAINAADFSLTAYASSFLEKFPDTLIAPRHLYVYDLTINYLKLGDLLYLNYNGTKSDSARLIPLAATESYARCPDGIGAWRIQKVATLAEYNFPQTFSVYEPVSNWIQYWDHAPFSIRDGAGSISFMGYMWLLSGWQHGPLTREIWRSKDGLIWEFVGYAPWEGRHHAGFVVYNNEMWVISGDFHSDVWKSADGVNWELVTNTAPWGERYAPYVTVYDNKLWLMGGMDYMRTPDNTYDFENPIAYNDVWSSVNGKDWVRVTGNAPWAPRGMIMGSVVHDNKMWIMGGGIKGFETYLEYNDVWNTSDGLNWNLVTNDADWEPRIHLSIKTYNNKMWLTDGSPDSASALTNEVWNSRDGIKWTNVTSDVIWSPRHASSLFNFDGSLWMVAGFNSNDVWRYTDKPDVWYSKASGDINDLTTWGSLPDGSGDHPASFTLYNQKFVLTNREHLTISEDFPSLQTNSELILGNGQDSISVTVDYQGDFSPQIIVSDHATLIWRSDRQPKLYTLCKDSNVIFQPLGEYRIPGSAYYNLKVETDAIVSIPTFTSVYGTLSCTQGTIKSDSSAFLSVFGDILISTNADISELNLRYLGNSDQLVVAESDSTVIGTIAISKSAGRTSFEGGIHVTGGFYASLSSENSIHVKDKLVIASSLEINCDTSDSTQIFGHVVLASPIGHFYTFKNTHFEKMEIVHIGSDVHFSSSDLHVNNAIFSFVGSALLDGDSSTFIIHDSLLINQDVDSTVIFQNIKFRLMPNEENMSIGVSSQVRFNSISIEAADSAIVVISGHVVVTDSLQVVSGGGIILSEQLPSSFFVDSNATMIFNGDEQQNISVFIPDTDSLTINRLIVSNTQNIVTGLDISVKNLDLVTGNLIVNANRIFYNECDINSFENSIVLNEDGEVLVEVTPSPKLVPVAYDSLVMPIWINQVENDTSLLSVGLKTSGVSRANKMGWQVRNVNGKPIDLKLECMWSKSVAPDEFGGISFVNVLTDNVFEIIENSSPYLNADDYYSINLRISLIEGVIIIGDQKEYQQIEFSIPGEFTFGDEPVALKGSSSSGLPLTYSVTRATVAAVKNDSLFINQAGEFTLRVRQSGNDQYVSAAKSFQIVVKKASQSIKFEFDQHVSFGDEPIKLNASSSSNLPIEFESLDTLTATIKIDSVYIRKAGTVHIKAIQRGTVNYLPADTSLLLTIDKAPQYLDFDFPDEVVYGSTALELNAVASSGLDVIFLSSDEEVAMVENNILRVLNTGTINLTAVQSGNENYSSVSLSRRVSVRPASQVLYFEPIPELSVTTPEYILSASSNTTLPIHFKSSDPNVASISGNRLLIHRPGVVKITAEQPQSRNYIRAAESRSVEIRNVEFSLLNDAEVEIYPNPGFGSFSVNVFKWLFKGYTAYVIDPSGNIIAQKEVPAGSSPQSISFHDLPSGIYFVEIRSTEFNRVYKIVILR